MQIFQYSDMHCYFLAQNVALSEKKIFMLVTLSAVADITSTTVNEDNVKNFEIFFLLWYFEDLLASITFAKKFNFLAGIVSKLLAIENAFAAKLPNYQYQRNNYHQKINFGVMVDWKSYLLCHINIAIMHKNLILEIGYA